MALVLSNPQHKRFEELIAPAPSVPCTRPLEPLNQPILCYFIIRHHKRMDRLEYDYALHTCILQFTVHENFNFTDGLLKIQQSKHCHQGKAMLSYSPQR